MITTRMIMSEVAQFYQLPVERMVSRERDSVLHLPRRMSWVLARDLTRHSIVEIGRRIGAVDHTTVLHGLKRIEEQMALDNQIAEDRTRIVEALRLREAEEAPIGATNRNTALEIATAILSGSLATTEPTVRELRILCEGVCASAARIKQLGTAQALNASELAQELDRRNRELAAASAITAAAGRVVDTAKTLAADAHTIRERGSRQQYEAALKALQTLFERN